MTNRFSEGQRGFSSSDFTVKALMALATENGLTKTIEIARALVEFWQDVKAVGRTPELKAQVDERMQYLIGHLLETYSGSVSPEELNAVFAEQRDLIDHDYLERLNPALVPIAVMRDILKRHRVLFTPSRVPNWMDFSTRYGDFILTG